VKRGKTTAAALLSVTAISFATQVHAQSANSSTLDEITVTAQKRVSTVHDTPISISAVSGDDLLARGVASLASLAQGTPGVSLKSEGPSQTEIEMRGTASRVANSTPSPVGCDV
jgi:iron complex outermembrane recepter protein